MGGCGVTQVGLVRTTTSFSVSAAKTRGHACSSVSFSTSTAREERFSHRSSQIGTENPKPPFTCISQTPFRYLFLLSVQIREDLWENIGTLWTVKTTLTTPRSVPLVSTAAPAAATSSTTASTSAAAIATTSATEPGAAPATATIFAFTLASRGPHYGNQRAGEYDSATQRYQDDLRCR